MPRRTGKRWAVEPDYELPVTRLKARQDPSILILPIQDLPRNTRRRRLEPIATVAVPPLQKSGGNQITAAVPHLENAEDNHPGTNSQQTQNGNQMEDMTTKNQNEKKMKGGYWEEIVIEYQKEEMATGNQIEETVEGNQLEDDTTENQTQEMTWSDLIEIMTEGNWQEEAMMSEIQMEWATEESPEGEAHKNPTELNDVQDQNEGMSRDDQADNCAPWTTMLQIDETVPWTDKDQRDLEKEIADASSKPINERCYSWNLIVGLPAGSLRKRSVAPDPSLYASPLQQLPSSMADPADQCLQDGYSTEGFATQENDEDSQEIDTTIGIMGKVSSLDTMANLQSVVVENRSITDMAASRSATEEKATTAEAIRMILQDTLSKWAGNTDVVQESLEVPPSDVLYPGHERPNVDKKTTGEATNMERSCVTKTAQENVLSTHPCSKPDILGTTSNHIQLQLLQVPASAQPPLRLSHPDTGIDKSGSETGETPLSPSEEIDALLNSVDLLDPLPDLVKPDTITNRQFVFSRHLQEQPNVDHQFSVVSYNIMAELEREDTWRGGETRATGNSGKAGGMGRGTDQRDGKADALSDLFLENYVDRLIIELHFLNPDIFCLQSIAEWLWGKLERNLNNWGYSGFMISRRPGSGSFCDAIFFRVNRFYFLKCDSVFLDDLISRQSRRSGVLYQSEIPKSVASREVVILVNLQCKRAGRQFRVVNTRCAPKHRQRPDLQAAQICSIMRGLYLATEQLPTILCGDFDFQPDEGPYQILRDGSMNGSTELVFNRIKSITDSQGQRCALSYAYRQGFRHSMRTIRSAYAEVLGHEPPTVWKRESSSLVCSSYVWFDSAELSVARVLGMVPLEKITARGIPTSIFPSGSLSLKAVFQFRKDTPATEDA